MSIKNKRLINWGLAGIGIMSGLLFYKRQQSQQQPKTIPPFFQGRSPYIFAHRGGMAVRPEQTQLAFDHAVSFDVDGFETDVRLTKDEKLIVFHDATVDRTTNGSGKVSEHTVAELKKLDAGYHFTDINGTTPYRGHEKTAILTFDELLKLYPNMRINVDLKDHPGSYEGSIAPQKMFDDILNNQAQDRVLVTNFYSKQIDRFNKIAQNSVAIGASQKEVAEGFLKFFSGTARSFHLQANTFQMPTHFKGIPLTSRRFIQWLNTLNIVPGYYGINSIDMMHDLYLKGAHTLVTDRPDLGKQFKDSLTMK